MFPKIIFQTWKNHDIPDLHKPWVESWKTYNPDYEYILWDDNENRDFVKKYYPDHLKIYDSFPVEIYRADYVRYLFLHKYGGIYTDIDIECLRNFDSLFEEEKHSDIIIASTSPAHIYKPKGQEEIHCNIANDIMISKPGNDLWFAVTDVIKEKTKLLLKKELDHINPDYITGPASLYEGIKRYGNKGISIPPHYYFHNYCAIFFYETKKPEPESFYIKLKRLEAIYKGSYAFTYWTTSWFKDFMIYNKEYKSER